MMTPLYAWLCPKSVKSLDFDLYFKWQRAIFNFNGFVNIPQCQIFYHRSKKFLMKYLTIFEFWDQKMFARFYSKFWRFWEGRLTFMMLCLTNFRTSPLISADNNHKILSSRKNPKIGKQIFLTGCWSQKSKKWI